MSHTHLRAKTIQLSRTDSAEALKTARSIGHPWYRCQSLAHTALYWKDARERNRILDESFESADACSTDYDKVASAAWPLKVLVLKDERERYRTRSQVPVSQASSIQNPISRVHALEQILGAIRGASNEVVESALNAFEIACGKMKSWKVDLAIQRIAVCYFGFAPERMMALVSSMKYQRIQRQTLETMEITKANPPVPNWPSIGFENE